MLSEETKLHITSAGVFHSPTRVAARAAARLSILLVLTRSHSFPTARSAGARGCQLVLSTAWIMLDSCFFPIPYPSNVGQVGNVRRSSGIVPFCWMSFTPSTARSQASWVLLGYSSTAVLAPSIFALGVDGRFLIQLFFQDIRERLGSSLFPLILCHTLAVGTVLSWL